MLLLERKEALHSLGVDLRKLHLSPDHALRDFLTAILVIKSFDKPPPAPGNLQPGRETLLALAKR